MKYLIFADIHGNGAAFSAFERFLETSSDRFEQVVFLGDLCGYYFNTLEIFPRLQQIPNLISVRGNHDQYLLDIAGGDHQARNYYAQTYSPCMEYLVRQDISPLVEWLEIQPTNWTSEDGKIFASHAGPAVAEYIYPNTVLEGLEIDPKIRYRLIGHSHHGMDRQCGKTRWINPGSLGQPRDAKGSRFVILDSDTGKVETCSVTYPIHQYIASLEKYSPYPEYMKKVLLRSANE